MWVGRGGQRWSLSLTAAVEVGRNNAIGKSGKGGPFSLACQPWFGQSLLVLEMPFEGRKQVPTYFPAA